MTKIEYVILLVYPIVLFFAYARVLCRGQVRCCYMECVRSHRRQAYAASLHELHKKRRSCRGLEDNAPTTDCCEASKGSDSVLLGRQTEGLSKGLQQELFCDQVNSGSGLDESGRSSADTSEESI